MVRTIALRAFSPCFTFRYHTQHTSTVEVSEKASRKPLHVHICDSVDGTILWHFRERYTKLPFKCSNTMLQIQINVCHFQAEYIMTMTMHIHCMLQAQFVCVPLFLPFVLLSGAAAAALPLWTETLEHLSGKAIDGPKTVCPRCGYTNKLWMSSAINVMRRRSFFSLSPSIPFKS